MTDLDRELKTVMEPVTGYLAEHGHEGPFALTRIKNGANNRSYEVRSPTFRGLAKRYYTHPQDTRDRLNAEWSFVSFAWQAGITTVPEPLFHDKSSNLALYEFIVGEQVEPGQVAQGHVRQALEFFRDLNRAASRAGARQLPRASEACLTTAEHLQCVDRRLDRLSGHLGESEVDHEARDFIDADLRAAWSRIREFALTGLEQVHGDIVPRLSPSDFGFHNAIVEESGRVRFIDFEYAGWDDPAKVVCDFFAQPQIPVPAGYLSDFAMAVAEDTSNPSQTLRRIHCLLPVHRVKWICILLNEFLTVGEDRRRFSQGTEDALDRKSRQLTRARNLLAQAVESRE